MRLYEALAIEDIRMACDRLRATWERTGGREVDGVGIVDEQHQVRVAQVEGDRLGGVEPERPSLAARRQRLRRVARETRTRVA